MSNVAKTCEQNRTRLLNYKVGNVRLENNLEKTHFLSFKPLDLAQNLITCKNQSLGK